MKKLLQLIIITILLSSCSTLSFNKKDITSERQDRLELLVKIIKSDDSKMLLDKDMKVKFLNFTRYNKNELVKISNALLSKIEKTYHHSTLIKTPTSSTSK